MTHSNDHTRNIRWHKTHVDKAMRAERFKQKPVVIWFTGLSGSGKSTSANALEQALFDQGHNTYLLDGDNVRHGLCKDLGFSDADRGENIRRVAELAKLMTDAGLIVITAFISPFREERNLARQLLAPGEFIEVFVDTPLATCEQRDPKGLYEKARSGQIQNFTGINSPYEPPEQAEIVINTHTMSVEQVVATLMEKLERLKVIR